MTLARRADSRFTAATAETVGRLLGVGSRLRGARIFHPYGVVCTARLVPAPGADRSSAVHTALFGAGGAPQRAVVRLSKSAGLPGALPDVLGLAVRLLGPEAGPGSDAGPAAAEDRPVDLLFGTTRGVRVLLSPARDWLGGAYSVLLPYRADGSLVWLRTRPLQHDHPLPSSLDAVREAVATGRLEFTVETAGLRGRWHPVGTLTVTGPTDGDVPFDPVVNEHPLLTPVPRWIAEVRRTAYEHSRRARGADRRSLTE